jgi:hypothetical protein
MRGCAKDSFSIRIANGGGGGEKVENKYKAFGYPRKPTVSKKKQKGKGKRIEKL